MPQYDPNTGLPTGSEIDPVTGLTYDALNYYNYMAGVDAAQSPKSGYNLGSLVGDFTESSKVLTDPLGLVMPVDYSNVSSQGMQAAKVLDPADILGQQAGYASYQAGQGVDDATASAINSVLGIFNDTVGKQTEYLNMGTTAKDTLAGSLTPGSAIDTYRSSMAQKNTADMLRGLGFDDTVSMAGQDYAVKPLQYQEEKDRYNRALDLMSAGQGAAATAAGAAGSAASDLASQYVTGSANQAKYVRSAAATNAENNQNFWDSMKGLAKEYGAYTART